ncbi:SIR2 family NAD-dependent protein deacylase [Nannocystaceae bacterium ST9]
MTRGPRCPEHLAGEIAAGNCVAFVGAGFSAAAKLPDWTTLLRRLAIKADRVAEVERALTEHEGSEGRYLAAQLLEDKLERGGLIDCLRAELVGERGPTMERRLALLRRIPFRAILTTNFDGLLAGKVAGEDSYVDALRPESHRWWEEQFWRDDESRRPGGPQVLELHGNLGGERDDVVLTRRDYRRRLYQDAGYQAFLRSVLATRTVLYLGFSFTDAYLSELRSEVLSLLDFRAGSPPVAYAVVADAPLELREFYARHEGIAVLDYSSMNKRDFSGFDRWLETIVDATSPRRRFARLFAGQRVLWLDPHPANNAIVHRFFAAIAGEQQGIAPVEVVEVGLAEQARDQLRLAREHGRPFDLVISHWGELEKSVCEGELLANGPRLLKLMRREDLRAPVVFFSTTTDLRSRRRLALSLGARAYCHTFQALFRELEAIVDDDAG